MDSNRCPKCGRANSVRASFCVRCKSPIRRIPSGSRTGRLTPNYVLAERYQIISIVGRGGFGAVYKAADTRLGDRPLAIKEMSQSRLKPLEVNRAIRDFRREALLLARLTHPNLPRIYDHFKEAGRWYLVMDFIEGETLADYLSRTIEGYLPFGEVLEISIQLCTVLFYLHTRQPPIIFRDLKPSNVMRTPEGNIYLIDFGIARHFKTGQQLDTTQLGTPGYSAPELMNQQSTPRSDIYSLGATLHQLLSGYNPSQRPFHFAPPSSYNQAVPMELDILIMRMLEREPSKRFANMAEIRQELQSIQYQWSHIGILQVEVGPQQGRIYELRKQTIRIGRNPDNDIHLEDLAISRHHASISNLGNGNYILIDEESVNGTKVNGQRLDPYQPHQLQNGDRIQLGWAELVFIQP